MIVLIYVVGFLCKMSLATNIYCEPSTNNCLNETSNSYFYHLLIEDGYRILVGETFLWSVWSWLVAHQAWILSIFASLVVGLSGIFPLLVIPIEEGANLKTGAAAKTLRVLLSFAVGGLLGDVFLHLLPEAWAAAETPAPSTSTLGGRRARPSMTPGLWVLAGILLFTMLEMMCSELNADRDDEDEANHDKAAAAATTNGAATSVGCLAPNGHLSETNGGLHSFKDHLTSNGGSHAPSNGHVTSNGGSHVSSNGHLISNGGSNVVTQNGGSHLASNGHATSNGISHVSSNGHVTSNGGSQVSSNGHVTSNGGSHVSSNGYASSNGGSHVATNGFVTSNGHLPEANGGAPSPLSDETIFNHVARTPSVTLLGHSASSSEYAVRNGCSSQLTNGTVTQAAERRPSKFGLPPVKQVAGYLNLLANSIDNFMHGLAVGGGFLVSVKMGTLTTLAILIHEVPHEIGDFAILLRAGFTRWEAARAQLYTAGSGLLGALTAVACSTSSVESRTSWVVPFTAGGFLHIALVTVLPELLAERDRWESAKQVVGLLTGMLVMMVLTACFD